MEIHDLSRRFARYCALEEGLAKRTVYGMTHAIGVLGKRTQAAAITDVSTDLLREFFYEGREVHQWAYATYMNYYKYLKKFLEWCVKTGHLSKNPILPIGRPKRPQSLPRRLSFEDAQRVLYGAFNYPWLYEFERARNHAIVATLLYSGLRSAELLELQMPDLNLEAGVILVRKGKGDKDRYVPIHHKLSYILRRYLFERARLRKTSPYVFTTMRTNNKLAYKTLYKMSKKVSKFSKVKFTPHCLRHTFASVSVEQGMQLPTLQQVMGHTDIKSTMIYVQLAPAHAKASLNSLDLF